MSSKDDPEMALQNVSSISDAKLRLSTAEAALKEWVKLNPELVFGLVQNSALSPEDRETIISNLHLQKQ